MEESGEHSRRRNRRRRPLAPHSEPVWRDPITREESRFRAGETGLSRVRRSRTRPEASSSVDAPVDSGTADPDPPARPQPRRAGGFTLRDPDGTVWGPFTTAGEHMQYDRTQGRQRPGTRSQQSQASSSSLSASPRSDHPGAEGGTRVRQSVLYSDRPRRSRDLEDKCRLKSIQL